MMPSCWFALYEWKKKRVGVNAHFCQTCWPCFWHHKYSLPDMKMVTLMAVFSRLSKADVLQTGPKLDWKKEGKKKKTVVSLFLYSIPVDRASDGSSFGESPWMYYGSDKSGPFNVYEIARVFLRTAAGIIYEFQLLKSSQSYTLPLHRRRGRRSQELHHPPGGHYIGCLGGSGNRAPDSWSEGRAFDTLRERRENFLFHT